MVLRDGLDRPVPADEWALGLSAAGDPRLQSRPIAAAPAPAPGARRRAPELPVGLARGPRPDICADVNGDSPATGAGRSPTVFRRCPATRRRAIRRRRVPVGHQPSSRAALARRAGAPAGPGRRTTAIHRGQVAVDRHRSGAVERYRGRGGVGGRAAAVGGRGGVGGRHRRSSGIAGRAASWSAVAPGAGQPAPSSASLAAAVLAPQQHPPHGLDRLVLSRHERGGAGDRSG